MAKEKRITLIEPISGHGELIKEVVLREPRSSDFFSLGPPYVIAQNVDGSTFPVEYSEIIKTYLDKSCVSPDPLLLAQLGLADAMAVKDALLSFFTQAQAILSKPATSSSST